MRRSSFVRRTAAAVVAVAALALTGCNGSDADPESAPEPTTAETTASPTPTEAESAQDDAIDPAAFIGDVVDALEDATTAHVTIEVAGGPASLAARGNIDYSTSPPSLAMKMAKVPFGPGTGEVRLVDGRLYVSLAYRSASKWIEVPLDGKDSPMGAGLAEQLDPGAGLQLVQDAVTDVTLVGEEDVDGETLEHYTMKVRTDAARRLEEQLGGAADLDLPSLVTLDVWIDEDGLLRRSEMALGDVGSVTTTMSDWGKPVDISAPPADEVMSFRG